jgi:uncharacterized protein involved in exopolysaccharide biosynthesis
MPPALGASAPDDPEPGAPQPIGAQPDPEAPRRRRLSSRTRRSVAVIGLSTLLGAAVVGAGSAASGPKYTSEAHVLWSPGALEYLGDTTAPTDPNALDRQVVDQQQVILSDAVMTTAADELDADVEELREIVAVSVQDESSLIVISTTGADADEATAVTESVTKVYIENVKASGAKALDDQAALLQSSIDRLNTELQSAQAELTAATDQLAGLSVNSPAYAITQGRADRAATRSAEAQTRLQDLLGQQESLRAAGAAYTGEAFLMRAASEPVAPSSPSLPTSLMLGGALGLFIGACIVFFFVGRRPTRESIGTRP